MVHWRLTLPLLTPIKCSYWLIEESVFIYKFLLSIFLYGNILIIKENWKMIGDASFYNLYLNPVCITEFVMIWSIVLVVCLVTCVGLLIVGIIPKRNIRFTKYWTFLFASKSSKLMLKTPAKVISLCPISRFKRQL